MEKFIQKFKRAYLALGMEEHKALQWAHTNGQVEYHKLNSLCSEGLIWHALTHRDNNNAGFLLLLSRLTGHFCVFFDFFF